MAMFAAPSNAAACRKPSAYSLTALISGNAPTQRIKVNTLKGEPAVKEM